MDRVRKLSIERLSQFSLDAVHKLELMALYELDEQWASDAYKELTERSSPLTSAEARRLGFDVATDIARRREELLLNQPGYRRYY